MYSAFSSEHTKHAYHANDRDQALQCRAQGIDLKFLLCLCVTTALVPSAAYAQRTQDNAVASANDAFGQSVGNERVGLYGIEDVRGFSPVEAGNSRIEGLYFAQIAMPPMRIITGNSVRVGISAQGYPFPAPTGIVDYKIAVPARENALTLSVERGQFGSLVASVEGRAPITDSLGAFMSVSRRHQVRHDGGDFQAYAGGASLAWRPYAGAFIVPFAAYMHGYKDDAAPTIFLGGDYLPPEIKRRQSLGQSWTNRDYSNHLIGLLGKFPLGHWQIDAGLFQAGRDMKTQYTDLFTKLRADGTTPGRIIVADGNNKDRNLSGEMRLTGKFGNASLGHRVTFSIKGKRNDRLFGGTQRINLGESSLLFRDERPEPVLSLGPEDHDRVSQATLGVAYGMAKPDRFAFDVALARSAYSKRVDFAALGATDIAVKDRPWTGSVTGSFNLSRSLILYAGHVRGFEDSLVAPEIAVNRGVAPPAIRTQQSEIGVRYAINPKVRLVAGVFTIQKPYFNLDPSLLFRRLGTTTNKGAELSLSGSVLPGLNMIAGAVVLDQKIAGSDVDSGLIGARPVGSVRRRAILNIDWRFNQGVSPLSFDLNLSSLSSRVGNATNRLIVPGRSLFDFGLRYRFTLGKTKALLRMQVVNIANTYSWTVTSSGAFQYERGRNLSAELIADF
jgi:iron complex outermembrane recepter protein